MQISYYFNYLTLRDKIILFLLVPLALFLSLSVIEKYLLKNRQININNKIKVYKKAIAMLNEAKKYTNNITMIKYIENSANNFNIKVINLKINKPFFNIHVVGEYDGIINFMFNIENSLEVKSFEIFQDNEKNIVLKGNYKLTTLQPNNQYKSIKDIPNPFNKKRLNKKDKLILQAVIGSHICINDKWYKKDDIVRKYKITKVYKDYVELSNKDKVIELKLYRDDK